MSGKTFSTCVGCVPDSSLPLPSSSTDTGSEIVGDEDEGFDEEFCDMEELPIKVMPEPHSSPLHLHDLNNPDLQNLLLESSFVDPLPVPFPTSSLLDDIDPGVYMLEAENSTHSLLEPTPLKSPVHAPSSPYHITAPSPVCANLQSMSLSDTCDVGGVEGAWELNTYQDIFPGVGEFEESGAQFLSHSAPHSASLSDYSSLSSSHCRSSSTPPPPACSGYDLDMLVSEACVPMDSSATLTGSFPSVTFTSGSNSSPTSPFLPRQVIPGGGSNPNLTCNFTLQMQMNFRGQTPPPRAVPVSTEPCHSPSPSPAGERCGPATPTLPSPVSHGYNSGVGFISCASGAGPSSSPHGVKIEPSSRSASCSTQTPLSPAPSVTSSCDALSSVNSADDPDVPKSKNGSADGIVHMPFYKFKKILDSPSLEEPAKSEIKSIRRRGKNKIAAKNCRQRKLDLILGLQHEIDQLKKMKRQYDSRRDCLQREIDQLKTRCSVISRRPAQS